jgi:hypothetical protein
VSGTWLRILRLTLHWRRLEEPNAAVQHEREKQRQHERDHEASGRATVDPNSPFTDLFRFEHPCCQAGDPPAARSPQRSANNGNTRRSLACSPGVGLRAEGAWLRQ